MKNTPHPLKEVVMIPRILRRAVFATTAFLCAVVFAGRVFAFTETFDTAAYKDTVNTTANWDTINSRAVLQRVSKFAQTMDVINWGGGITTIEYGSPTSWMIGGLQGKLNEFDGTHFIDRTATLVGFYNSNIRAIKHNNSTWFIGGDGPNLNRRDNNGPWTNVKNSLVDFSGAINAINCTPSGNYWLFGGETGSLNGFDGTSWVDFKYNLNFQPNAVKTIGYSGSYWLIAGANGKIAKYDGFTFTDLTAQLYAAWGSVYYDINTMDWNGSYWVLGGGAGKIATYDGTTFTNTSTYPSGTPLYTVWSIKWNGYYWLIGGSKLQTQTVFYTTSDANITPYTEQSNPAYFSAHPIWAIASDGQANGINMIGGQNGCLMKRTGTYNSPINTDFSRDALDFGSNAINFAESNNSYWLVGGVEGSLNTYDGTNFTDLKANPSWTALNWTADDVLCAGWNSANNYWLIGGTSGKLAKFDGTNFLDRTSALGFGNIGVKTIKWNGSQWVIGGGNRNLSISADGDNFQAKDISPYFGAYDPVNKVEWIPGQSSWFIGGGNGGLVMYNGVNSYADLKNALYSCLGGYYSVNTLKYDGLSKIRIGCGSAEMADYEAGAFSNISGRLVNFGTADIYDMDYSPSQQQWIIGGKNGKINIASGAGAGVYTDESGNLVNFNSAAINTVAFNGVYWIIGGDNAKLNRYGLSYVSPGWVYSTMIDQWFAGYSSVTLTSVQALNGQQIDYWLSANNGSTWLPAIPGIGVAFTGVNAGDKLKWRAMFTAYDDFQSPSIDTVIINYNRVIAPTYTVTKTSTRTYTPTVTPVVSSTVTPTITMTGTNTATITLTATPTITQTSSYTPTITATPTFTGTITQTNTPTATATNTATMTATYTATGTGTITQTATYSVTENGTAAATGTESPTSTVTSTPQDVTPGITETISGTITPTMTAAQTTTMTSTPGPSFTATVTPAADVVPVNQGTNILYPNPARNTVNISYAMVAQGNVKIRIYNETGDLAALKDENKPAGPQISVIDISRLAPGVYMYFLTLDYNYGNVVKFGLKKFIVLR